MHFSGLIQSIEAISKLEFCILYSSHTEARNRNKETISKLKIYFLIKQNNKIINKLNGHSRQWFTIGNKYIYVGSKRQHKTSKFIIIFEHVLEPFVLQMDLHIYLTNICSSFHVDLTRVWSLKKTLTAFKLCVIILVLNLTCVRMPIKVKYLPQTKNAPKYADENTKLKI